MGGDTIVKILEGLGGQVQLYFSQCLGHYSVLKNGKSKEVGVMGFSVKFSLQCYKKLTFDTTKGMVQVFITQKGVGRA